MAKTKNPFAKPDGTPLDGKAPEFFAWAQDQYQKKLDKMPPAEKKAQLADDAHLAKKMNS